MKCFVVVDAKGNFIAAYPKIGIAKIHMRTELKDKIVSGYCLAIEKPAKKPKPRHVTAARLLKTAKSFSRSLEEFAPKKSRKGAKK